MSTEGQGPTTTQQPAAPAAQPTAEAVNVESLLSQLKETQKRVAELSQEAADRRVKAKEADERAKQAEQQRLEALKASGELKPVVEKLEAEKAELVARLSKLEPVVEKATAARAKQKEQIEAKKESLPSYLQKSVEKALTYDDVEGAYEILADYEAAQKSAPGTPTPKTPAQAPTVANAPPPSEQPINPDRMTAAEIQNLERTNPQLYARHFGRNAGSSPPGGFLRGLFGD